MTKKRFPDEAKMILEKVDRQYETFWKTTPDIGRKKNMQFNDLDFFIAFFSFMRLVASGTKSWNWNNPLMAKMAMKLYTCYKKKIDAHIAYGEWGNAWRVEMNSEGHAEVYAIHTRMCPIVDFCKAHGYDDFLSAIRA